MLPIMTSTSSHDTPVTGMTTKPVARLVAGPALPLDSHAGILPELAEWAASHAAGTLDAGQLAAIFAHSWHLQGLARAHPQIIGPILAGDGDMVVRKAIAELEATAAEIEDETAMMAAIRRLRQ